MKEFIENCLNIKNYKIYYFNSGRNNITCLVESSPSNPLPSKEGEIVKFVIQKEDKNFPDNQKYLIEEIIKTGEKLNLASGFGEKRFYDFDGNFYQVMDYIESINLDEKNLEIKSILSMFSYLAKFHNLSESIEIEEEKKDIGKTFKSVEELFLEIEDLNKKDLRYNIYFEKILKIKNEINLIETCDISLKKGIIHGDTAFKNFLFDKNTKQSKSLIDYEKVEYNNFLWDLADLIRSLLKVEKFDNKFLIECIVEYEKGRKLDNLEKAKLKNFLETLVFHVIMQYFSALFPEGTVNNMIGDEIDTIKKLERGFGELEKIKNFNI